MAKLIMWNLVTLDGYMEGPGRDISWLNAFWGEDLEQLSIEQGRSAGALLFGRVTYELMASHWPTETGEIADFMNALPKYVASRSLTQPGWTNTQLINSGVNDAIVRLKREIPKDIFIFGSADLSAGLTEEGLIDEYRICVTPLFLGKGTPLFKPGRTAKLRRLDARPLSNGAVILRYAPA
ncbi:riboflavin biosynthesis protein RibD [Afipia sp. P52-10]|jgi:dihydrofolate reductase|uniref:dihydrofolate reductase family protein n=1 Tax=Afipia sp. P52-10 TaxID=1429916 RepID=UPI0003DF36E4|nr:dihydrofolate reductase family protein [Afipia sp. P52-10]ETR77108.1 riboflavin biosynthesis protein RibD [Afipia sp. P52-10]